MNPVEVLRLTKNGLIGELKKLNLSHKGKKAELQERLMASITVNDDYNDDDDEAERRRRRSKSSPAYEDNYSVASVSERNERKNGVQRNDESKLYSIAVNSREIDKYV